VHFAAAVWAVFWLGGLPPLPVGGQLVDLGWAGHLIAVLAVVWTLNLFNFMDGIDGIAASEAVFVAAGGAALCLWVGGWSDALAAGFILAAACAGFLAWNWPPAKIFMGDVGSGYVGYAISVLALAATRSNPVAVWVWLILGGAFFADATVSLIRRVARGERAHDAHRSHAYQWLARRWGSHRRVTLTVFWVNVLWLTPWAAAASRYPAHAAAMVLGALLPLAVLALIAGAGRREAT
jgi:Fuc2NAc and GlcNAc transferase